jgi:phosphate/phosphite/phosphonate ABC transporter binding protein
MRYLLLAASLFLSLNTFSQKVVLATYQYANNNRLENIRPLSKYLFDSVGLEVEIKSYPSVHQFIHGIQNDEVDIALINTFGYLLLESAKRKYTMKPVVVLKVQEGAADNYKTAVLVKKGFPIDSITNLKEVAHNYTLGLVNPGSTSGNLLPRLKMAAIGIASPENSFKSVEYCQNHKNAVEMLLQGRIDICAVGSTEYFNLLADTGRANLVKLLWLSSEIPLGPVLLHNRLSKATQQKIVTHLLKLDRTSPTTLEAIKSGWSEAKQAYKYIEMDMDYYTPFKNQFGDKKISENILKKFSN